MTAITASDIYLRIEAGSLGAPIDGMLATSDGRHIITRGADKTVRIWDALKKRQVRTLRWQIGLGRIGEVVDMVLNPDNRLLFVATRNVDEPPPDAAVTCSIRIFDLESGDLVRLRPGLGGISRMAVALGGQGLLILDSGRSSLRLFTKVALLDPDNHDLESIARVELPPGPTAIATRVSDGREQVVVAGHGIEGGWLSVFDLSAGNFAMVKQIALPIGLNPVGLACRSTRIAVGGAGPHQLAIYGPALEALGDPLPLDAAPEGMVFFGDTRVGRTCERALTHDWLMLGGSDPAASLWYLPDVESPDRQVDHAALRLFVGSDGEWVIWSKSCFYNASEDGERYFGFHINQGEDQEAQLLTADRFERLLNKPGVIREILRTGSEPRALASLGLTAPDILSNLPPVVECHEPAVFRFERSELDLEIAVRPAGRPIQRVWILRNGLPVWEDHTAQAEPRTYTALLPLVPGENRFRILASSESAKSVPLEITVNPVDGSGVLRTAARGAGWSALIEILTDAFAQADAAASAAPFNVVAAKSVYGQAIADDAFADNVRRAAANPALPQAKADSAARPVKPNLYALVVGVSKIKNPHGNFHNLKYADDDARAVAKTLRSQKNGLFQKVKTWELLNKEATLQGIRDALAELEQAVRARNEQRLGDRQNAPDVTVVFLAGHGVQTRDDRFYFWTHDMDWNDMQGTGLSFIELGEIVTSFPSELLFLIDACHSGMAGGAALSAIRPEELSRRLVAINEGAQTILSAADKGQLALETSKYQHGYFTAGVLSVLTNSVGDVSNMALAEGTMRAVEILSEGAQTPSMRVFGDLHRWILYRPPPATPPKPAGRSKSTSRKPATRARKTVAKGPRKRSARPRRS